MKISRHLGRAIKVAFYWLFLSVNVVDANAAVYVADLVALADGASNLTGKAIVYGESNVIGYAGYAISVESNLAKETCSSPNACRAQIHNGTGCGSLAEQGEHLYGPLITTDPWTNKIYTSDSTGYGRFGDVLDIGMKSANDKIFICT